MRHQGAPGSARPHRSGATGVIPFDAGTMWQHSFRSAERGCIIRQPNRFAFGASLVRPRPNHWPELSQHRVGRRFVQRPSEAVVREFLGHVWRTGTPQSWPALTTTPHPVGEAPVILTAFTIPPRLRNGQATRAPCAVCSPSAPKFDEGFFVLCADQRVRIIGRECGHHFFGDSYAEAVQTHDAEVAEAAARTLLRDRLPDLSRTLIEAVTVARDLATLLDFRERAFSVITLAAVTAMRRCRVGDHLTIQIDSPGTDAKGRKLSEMVAVAEVPGLDALSPRAGLLGELVNAVKAASAVWVVERDEIAERLAMLSSQEAFVAAKAVGSLDRSLKAAHTVRDGLGKLFSREGLAGLSTWGRHIQCPKPFWIETTATGRVYLGKGLRPRFWDRGAFLSLPPEHLVIGVKVQ